MKKIFKFVLNLITTLAACIPCFLFFKWVGEKGIFDWKDILLIMIGISSIILCTYIALKRKKEKILVVAAECDTIAVAESICAMLKNNEIEAIAVDKESPIYNKVDKNSSQAQVQVCNKDLKKAKELIG